MSEDADKTMPKDRVIRFWKDKLTNNLWLMDAGTQSAIRSTITHLEKE
jgi:hypothetical protein